MTCDTRLKQRIFGESTLEKILEVLATSENGFTFEEIAKRLGKDPANIRQAINRKGEHFYTKKPDGRKSLIFLSQIIQKEILQRIDKIKAEDEVETTKIRDEIRKQNKQMKQKKDILIEAKNFFELHKKELSEYLRKGESIVYIDFMKIAEFSHILSDEILSNSEKTLRLIELAVEESGLIENVRVRIKNLPDTSIVLIEDVRSRHLNEFISIKGKVLQRSEARPQVVNAKFECPSCGTVIAVLQIEKKFREPSQCSCGRRGGFKLINKEMVDTARFVIQDLQEIAKNSSPSRLNCFVKEDLASSYILNNIIQAGNDVIINGILKEVPVPLTSGGLSTRFEFAVEVNYVELAEESIELENLTEEEIKEFNDLSKMIDEKGIEELTPSYSPVVKGYDYVKQALILYSCNRLNNPGIDEERNKSNILLIGDPSCVSKDSYVTLRDGTFCKITKFKDYKNKSILLNKKFSCDKEEARVSKFWHYKNYPTKKVITQTGKELICSYNHPLWIKRKVNGRTVKGWVRVDSIYEGDKIKVMKKIRCKKKKYIKLKEPSSSYGNEKKIKIPYCNEKVGLLFGIVTGDGWVDKYRVSMCYPEKEKIVGDIFRRVMEEQFGVGCKTLLKPFSKKVRFLNGKEIKEKEKVYHNVINSKFLAEIFKCEKAKKKRIPEIIMESKDSVLANFLKGLFSTDGCCFISKTKDRTDKMYVQLKSMSHKLLLDVQLALIRFGIQARINQDDLEIKKIEDVKKFLKYIGFVQKKKQKVLEKSKNFIFKGRKHLTYEKIKSVTEGGVQDVFDITVPTHHRFISNGIISHNTAKSVLVRFLTEISIGAKKVVGGSSSAVGITGSVTKDEFLGGWMINPGALVLAKDVLFLEELNTMEDEEKAKIQDAMESQYVDITKANVSGRYKVKTGIVSCANPIAGHFIPSWDKKEIVKQFKIPTPILSRFDTIFIFRDIQKEDLDFEISMNMKKRRSKLLNVKFDKVFLKKFFYYIKSRKEPEMSLEFEIVSARVYSILRRLSGKDNNVNARLSEAIDRMTIASAKLRGSDLVEEKDLERVINILSHSYLLTPEYSIIKESLDMKKEIKQEEEEVLVEKIK